MDIKNWQVADGMQRPCPGDRICVPCAHGGRAKNINANVQVGLVTLVRHGFEHKGPTANSA